MSHLPTTLALATLALASCILCTAARAQEPGVRGYVTRVSSPDAFDVNGTHVLVTPKTEIVLEHHETVAKKSVLILQNLTALPALFLGQPVEVTGEEVHRATEIKATRLVFLPASETPVGGMGIVDLIPSPAVSAEGRFLRADGYLMLIPVDVGGFFAAPLKSFDDIRTNQWVRYHGVQRADGVLVLDRVEISPNIVNHREDKLRSNGDYDPSQIDAGDAQSGASKFFLGKNIARLPAWHDAAMQSRVDRIGHSLVPAFQKALPEDDDTRIDFRFQVIDEPRHGDAWSLASGIVLVPRQVVERLPDDSQLAAVLADSIAEVLEKQSLRSIPAAQKMTAASYAGNLAGLVIPGAGVATLIANHEVAKSIERHEQQQSGRVSLCLMHDAGYDIAAAPMAWWTLATKSEKSPLPKSMPEHTLFLYEYLGTVWRPQNAATHASASPTDGTLLN